MEERNHLSHTLFLLMVNLSQQRDKARVISLFMESINSIFPGNNFRWVADTKKEEFLDVCTRNKSYGKIIFKNNRDKKNDVSFKVIQNAVQMLAVVLERLEQEKLLADEKMVLMDMVDEKTAELRLSKERYKDIVEQLNDWVWEINEKGIYTYSSPSVETILGYTPDEVIGKTPFSLMPPEEAEKISVKFVNISDTREPFIRLENINLHKNGNKVVMETSGVPIFDERGNYKGYRGVDRDITERKLIQQQIYNIALHAEEKERSRVAKELHDGVAPILSAIRIYLQSFYELQNEKVKVEALKKIDSSIDDAIRSLSEISNNLSPHILQNFGLTSAIQSFTERVSDTKRIRFTIKSDLEERLQENMEITLYRVIIELINNTLKHARADEIFIAVYNENRHIKVIYKDNGIGFDYDSALEKRKGMGLFNLKNRVELLNGNIILESTHNKGVLVTLSIPIKPE